MKHKRFSEPDSQIDESPPIMGKWSRLYATVLIIHVLLMLFLWLFGRHWS